MIKPFVFIAIFIAVLVSSCMENISSKNNFENEFNADYFTLEKSGEKKFLLDSLTPSGSNMYQLYIDSEGDETLTFLNSHTNSIYYYDFTTTELLKILKFEVSGPVGVGRIMGYHIHNYDSIFIYNYNQSRIYLSDINGRILNKFIITQDKYLPAAKISTVSPLYFTNNKFYLTGNISGEYPDETAENRPVQLQYDLQNGYCSYNIPYPEIYRKANWGGGQYRWVESGVNPEKRLLLYSFPVDHYLYGYNIDSKEIIPFYAGSKYFNEIPSVPVNTLLNNLNKDEIRDHYSRFASYHSVAYDPFQQFYFRVAWLPNENYDPKVKELRAKETSIILIDEKFRKIGEVKFPKFSYKLDNFFITKDGLYFLKYSTQEDVLSFAQFKLKKIENE